MDQKKTFSAKNMAMIALFTALTCVLAPLAIPIGPVPISLTNLVLYLAMFVLGTQKTAISFVVYLLLGVAGLPVFSGFTGGIAKLAGPSGGYLVGFLPMIFVAGWFIRKFEGRFLPSMAGMILGTLACYVLGTIWFIYLMGSTVSAALAVCVFPFIPGDLIKMVVAQLLGMMLRNRLRAAHLMEA